MSKKHKVTLLVVGILLSLSLIIASSYAYYIFSISQSSTNVVRADCFEMTYSDSNAINITDGISLTDAEANDLTPYTFTITNVCNVAMEYNINIETLNTSTLNLNYVAARLDSEDKVVLGTVTDNDSSVIVNTNISSSKTIYNGLLRHGESKTHNLRLWIDESATVEQSANKSFSSKVVVNGVQSNYKEATLIPGPLFNKAIKILAGDEPDEDAIEIYNNSVEYSPIEDYNIYNETADYNIKNIALANQKPSNNVETTIVSTNDSDVDVLAWFDTDTLYLYSKADKIYLNEYPVYNFGYLRNLQNLDLSIFDTSKCTTMSNMFYILTGLTSLDLSPLDTSNVTDMSYMFYNMENLTSLDLSPLDTSNVTNMAGMFIGLRSLTSLDISPLDTTKVNKMHGMFMSLTSLTSLDISSLDTSNVTDMSGMFMYLTSLTSLDVSSLDTSKVTNMNQMFFESDNLKTIYLGSIDVSNVTKMDFMFAKMDELTTIYVDQDWTINSMNRSSMMFYETPKIVGGAGTVYELYEDGIEYAHIDGGTSNPGYFTVTPH